MDGRRGQRRIRLTWIRDPVSRRASRSPARRLRHLALLLLVAACNGAPDHLSYDQDGVAQDVLALVHFNAKWAQDRLDDAVLYRIELRNEIPRDSAPVEALYSFYAPGSASFLTATSDPAVPWSGAEPLDWPAGRAAPLPLPPVRMDFKEAWRLATATGISRVTTAVLEVNQRNGVPIVAWSISGQMADLRERGVYFDALTGERLYAHTLFDPPTTATQVDEAISNYRGALRGDVTQDPMCPKHAVPVPARRPVTCFDATTGTYAPYATQE